MGAPIVAIIDWGSAVALKDNRRALERAGLSGRPRRGAGASARGRTLVLRGDGTCELHRFTVKATARRLGGTVVHRTARKVRNAERG